MRLAVLGLIVVVSSWFLEPHSKPVNSGKAVSGKLRSHKKVRRGVLSFLRVLNLAIDVDCRTFLPENKKRS